MIGAVMDAADRFARFDQEYHEARGALMSDMSS